MKTTRKLIRGLAMTATILSLGASARAGIFTWSAPAAITDANTTLNQTGTVVGGAGFGTLERIVTLTNGTGIDFKTDGSVATATGQGTFNSANTNQTGNVNFNTILAQANYDGGPKTITLNNLTVGEQYSVQLFALDDRGGGIGARQANFADPGDATNVSATFRMRDNVYVVGTFTATNTTQSIQENLITDTGGNINALVVRQLSSLPLAPQIVVQPQPATIYNGRTAQLTVTAYGTALTYQWQKSSVGGVLFTNVVNGGRISGATNLTLIITNLAAGDTGDYQVVITNGTGSVTTTPATLTVQAGTPLFAWSASVPITLADSTLNVTGTVVSAAVFGSAEKIVTLTNGTVLDFKADGSAAAVTQGGSGLNSAAGAFIGDTGNANFNAALTQFNYDGGPKTITLYNLVGGQQYSVQLFALDDRGGVSSGLRANFQDPADSVNVSDSIFMGDNQYIVGTFTAPGSGIVSVNIQENLPDNGGGGNINALVVRALGALVAPQITLQPQSVTIDQSLNTKFTVAASGSTPLTYRWQRGAIGSGIFTNFAGNSRYTGTNSSTLTITNLVVSDSADYQVIVANAVGSVTSSPAATLSVQPVTPQFVWAKPGTITTADTTLAQAGSIVGAEVFGPSPKIVVLTNGSSVDFKNTGAVATADGDGTFTGAYSGNTGNANFNAVLNQASYEIYQNPVKTITLQNLIAGQQYAVQLFALDDRGGAASRYANFQDPADPNDYSDSFFMPENAYVIGTFTASGPTVVIQENFLAANIGGNLNAVVLRRLSGLPVAPVITTQPLSSAILNAGANIQFTVGASGTPLTYQWQRAAVGSGVFSNVGDANASGVATAQLTITNLTAANTADYRVIVSNGAGSVTSSPSSTLTVISTPTTLTHRWSFNEVSGTTAADSVGGANGTLQGGATFSSGAVYLSNPGNPQSPTNNSYVSIPGGLVSSLASLTFETWVTNSGLNNGNSLIGFGGPITGTLGVNYLDFFLRMPGSQNAFWINTTAGNSGIVNLGSRVQNGTFHWVMTYAPADGLVKLYLNGSFYGSASGVTIPLNTVGTNVGYIGYSAWNQSITDIIPGSGNTNCPFYNGSIDEVRIYSGILNSNVIADDYVLGPNQLAAAPQITSQPTGVFVAAGATAQFTVSATGNPLNYQWQRGTAGSGVFTNINAANATGATTSQLTIANVTTNDLAGYRVIAFNGSGSVTSSPATLTIGSPVTTLVHRWNFNETSGSTAADSIGGANGTLVNGSVGSGSSVSFDGTGKLLLNNPGVETNGPGSYVSLPGGLVSSLSAVTFEFWYDNSGLNNGNPWITFGGPIDHTTLHGTNFINFFARWSGSTTAFEIQTTAGDSGVVTLGSRQQGGTFHWVLIYDPNAGKVSAYLNGNLQASASGITIPLSTVGTSVGYIGLSAWNQVGGNTDPNLPLGTFLSQYGFNANGNYPYLNANMDEMRIYDGALNTNAIAATQLLGPNQLLSNVATLSASNSVGNLTLSWPIVNGAFSLETSPVLGVGAVWTPVTGTKSVVGSNYQITIPSGSGTAFFRLHQ